MQLIMKFKSIFDKAGIGLWLNTYDIIVVSSNSGIIGNIYSLNI